MKIEIELDKWSLNRIQDIISQVSQQETSRNDGRAISDTVTILVKEALAVRNEIHQSNDAFNEAFGSSDTIEEY